MNRKPFNLEEALAGKPVVNGLGKAVFITKLGIPKSGIVILSQNADGSIAAYHSEHGKAEYNEEFDLFMVPEEVTEWVNLYPASGMYSRFTSQEAADSARSFKRLGGKAFPITYTV